MNTPHLRLEPLRREHANLVHSLRQDQRLYTYLPQEPPSLVELEERFEYLEHGLSPDGKEHWLNWIVFLHDTSQPVGSFQATIRKDQNSQIAYETFVSYWRKGYATEAGISIITHIFDNYETNVLEAEIDTRNTASIRLVESLGFDCIACNRNVDFFKGASSDEYRYVLRRGDWQIRHSGD